MVNRVHLIAHASVMNDTSNQGSNNSPHQPCNTTQPNPMPTPELSK